MVKPKAHMFIFLMYLCRKSIRFTMLSGSEITKSGEVQVYRSDLYDTTRKPIEHGLLDPRMVRLLLFKFLAAPSCWILCRVKEWEASVDFLSEETIVIQINSWFCLFFFLFCLLCPYINFRDPWRAANVRPAIGASMIVQGTLVT